MAISGTAKNVSPPQVEAFRRELDEQGRGTQYAYVALLGLKAQDVEKLHARIEEGLSYAALERLQRVLGVSTSRLSVLLRIPARTLTRRRASKRLQADESDRLLRLSRVVGLALQLFEGDLESARHWLNTQQAALGGRSPLEFTTSEVGTREVENLIGRLEHGIPL